MTHGVTDAETLTVGDSLGDALPDGDEDAAKKKQESVGGWDTGARRGERTTAWHCVRKEDQ